jgi:sulfide:quinone oxidoreductase
MGARILVLGTGVGGLEPSTILSDQFGEAVEVTIVDKSDAFVFGFSKLDLMIGRTSLDAVRLPYAKLAKPGARLMRERITAIDPRMCLERVGQKNKSGQRLARRASGHTRLVECRIRRL